MKRVLKDSKAAHSPTEVRNPTHCGGGAFLQNKGCKFNNNSECTLQPVMVVYISLGLMLLDFGTVGVHKT